jgi:hypothetical protein
LAEDSVVKNSFTTDADRKGCRGGHSNIDAIISVGYYAKSGLSVADHFAETRDMVDIGSGAQGGPRTSARIWTGARFSLPLGGQTLSN